MLLAKHILILGVFGSYVSDYFCRFLGISGAAKFGYLVMLILSLLSVYLLAFLRNDHFRFLFAVVLAFATLVGDSYVNITAEPYSYHSFINLVTAAAFIGDAFTAYGAMLVTSIIKALMLLAGIMLSVRGAKLPSWITDARVLVFFIFVISSLSIVIYARGGAGGTGLQRGITNISYFSLLLVEMLADEWGERKSVEIMPSEQESKLEDIVLIIDESVRGDYLDINNFDGVRSGLKENTGRVFNFGLAASATTCSYGSNVLLRYGGTRLNFREKIGTGPAIWSFAKAAGFRTIYIDAQRTSGGLQNGMSEQELKAIDKFIQFDEIDVIEREPETARTIISILGDGSKDFVIVNKMGAHFPINDKYPDSFLRYEPVLERGVVPIMSDIGNESGLIKGWDWNEYSNSYKNTLEWAVGAFFDLILQSGNLQNAAIIYTADHGQTFHEDNSPGLRTHCSSISTPQEGAVPMVIISGTNELTEMFTRYSKANFNQSSHYNIFSTILYLMGFSKKDYEADYGFSLFQEIKEEPTFNTRSGISRLGSKPAWMGIEGAIKVDKIPE